MFRWKYLTGLMALVMLGGCATPVPELVRKAPSGNPQLSEVRAQSESFRSSRVRWGGSIQSVENRPSETWIQVVAFELAKNGRPIEDSRSQGRFLARFDGFLDPLVYKTGRWITVTGTVSGQETRAVGEYPYVFPIVHVESHYLWEPRRRDYPLYDPFWYDPWYDPWYPYPWRRYPYW